MTDDWKHFYYFSIEEKPSHILHFNFDVPLDFSLLNGTSLKNDDFLFRINIVAHKREQVLSEFHLSLLFSPRLQGETMYHMNSLLKDAVKIGTTNLCQEILLDTQPEEKPPIPLLFEEVTQLENISSNIKMKNDKIQFHDFFSQIYQKTIYPYIEKSGDNLEQFANTIDMFIQDIKEEKFQNIYARHQCSSVSVLGFEKTLLHNKTLLLKSQLEQDLLLKPIDKKIKI